MSALGAVFEELCPIFGKVIRHRLLHCRYAKVKRKALQDAQLYARTGPIRATSPSAESRDDGQVQQLERKKQVKQPISVDTALNQQKQVQGTCKSQASYAFGNANVLVLSSNTEEEYYTCDKKLDKVHNNNRANESLKPLSDGHKTTTESTLEDSDLDDRDAQKFSDHSIQETSSDEEDSQEDLNYKVLQRKGTLLLSTCEQRITQSRTAREAAENDNRQHLKVSLLMKIFSLVSLKSATMHFLQFFFQS